MDWAALANRENNREGTDFYPTPPDATAALMAYLNLPAGTKVWEPACGQGHMVRELEAWDMDVYATDLFYQGVGIGDTDFTGQKENHGCEWLITNPPFALAERFIEQAASIGFEGGFAFLLKSQYWHAKSRLSIWERFRPSHILPLTWRPDFLFGAKRGASVMECIWCVWDSDWWSDPVYRPLPRERSQQEQTGLFT